MEPIGNRETAQKNSAAIRPKIKENKAFFLGVNVKIVDSCKNSENIKAANKKIINSFKIKF